MYANDELHISEIYDKFKMALKLCSKGLYK